MKSLYVVTLALVLVLSGCGADPGPPTAPAPPTPSETKPAAAPVMPEAAKEDSKAGATSFVRHYVQLLNRAQATGDTGPLVELEGKNCGSCAKVRKAIDQIYASRGRVQGGALRLVIDDAGQRPDFHGWSVFAFATYGESKILKPKSKPKTLRGGKGPLNFDVAYLNGKPTMLQWTRG